VSNVLKLTEEEIQAIRETSKSIEFMSKLSFLHDHNGYRRGKLHTICGESGGGKSTIQKTLLVDLLLNNKEDLKIALWLSEEEGKDLIAEFSNQADLSKALTKGVFSLFSEIENPKMEIKDLERQMRDMLKDCDIFFFDNITTSKLYQDRALSDQSKVAVGIKSMIKRYDKPMVIFSHTGGSLNRKALSQQNDIRGNKSLVNISEIIYMVQQFQHKSKKITTLRCVKNRGNVTKSFGYFLRFDKEQMVYTESKEQTAEIFNKVLKVSSQLNEVR